MREDQHRFLTLRQLPARLTAEQAGWVLNCGVHDIKALMAAKMLKPLGNPSPNSTKYFATADLLEQVKDRHWLARVTVAINQHWRKRNQINQPEPAELELAAPPAGFGAEGR